jgi:leucyl-tRNA synthetase
MVYCEKCAGWFPIDEKDLPLELPYLKSYEPGKDGKSPLEKATDWTKAKCPNCGSTAKRETDTMPNWAGSCWYFLRFVDPKNEKEPWSKDSLKKLMPVDWYMGGSEHAVLHLLYSRFWVKALFDLGLVDFTEPFLRLRNVGMVLAQDHKKMSKSLGNVINPDEVIEEYGADSLRIYEMFMAPFSQEISWSTQTLQGSYRFIKRIWQIFNDPAKITKEQKPSSKQIVAKLQSTIFKVSGDITNVKFNTAIAFMMEFLNEWEKEGVSLSENDAKLFLKILSPFAPFVTEEIWKEIFKEEKSIHLSEWPKVLEKPIVSEEVKIPVQTNGKLRAVLTVSRENLSEKNLIKKALELESVKKHLMGKKYKIIYREGKILNFVAD